MEQGEYLSPYAWGRQLSKLLEHKLATYLSQVDVKTLSEAEARTVLYEQLRSFLALKSTLKSSEPQSDILQPAHEALLSFAARLFMAAHQALLDDGKAKAGEQTAVSDNPKWQYIAAAPSAQFLFAGKLFMAARQVLPSSDRAKAREQPTMSGDAKWQHTVAAPSTQFLLEWQLVRLKASRERLILELADLSAKHQNTFRELKLSEAVGAEVESARLRVSKVWKKLPPTASYSNVPKQAGGYTDTSR